MALIPELDPNSPDYIGEPEPPQKKQLPADHPDNRPAWDPHNKGELPDSDIDIEYAPPANTEGAGLTHDAKFFGIGGDPELWKEGDTYYMVYYAPGPFEPPIATLWRVPDEETLKAFGGGSIPDVDKNVTAEDIENTGSIIFGTTDELPDSELDPWTGFKETMERASKVQPWLSDPETYAIIGAAYVEGRAVEAWELQDTEWWRSRNDRQRAWAEIQMADPSTAEQQIASDKTKVNAMFESIGAVGNDQAMIDYMATQYTIGNWDQTKLAYQVEAVTSGWGDVDQGLVDYLAENGVDAIQSLDKTEEVRATFLRWLGPAFPASDDQIKTWATKLRNNPGAGEELTAMLRGQRMALFPEYADENLTYEDIAAPWRSVVEGTWGEIADETSSEFVDIVKMNSMTDAQQYLRREGMAQGKEKVVQDFSTGVAQAQRGSVRRAE